MTRHGLTPLQQGVLEALARASGWPAADGEALATFRDTLVARLLTEARPEG